MRNMLSLKGYNAPSNRYSDRFEIRSYWKSYINTNCNSYQVKKPVTCIVLHYCHWQPTGGVFVAPKEFPCKMVRMVLKNDASWSLNKKQKRLDPFLTSKMTLQVSCAILTHFLSVSTQRKFKAVCRSNKMCCSSNLNRLSFETSNCYTLLWQHLTALAVLILRI